VRGRVREGREGRSGSWENGGVRESRERELGSEG